MVDVRDLSRKAYELGRFRGALGAATLTLILPALALAVGAGVATTLFHGALLYVLATVLLWRGQAWARGFAVGLWAGALPALAALGLIACGVACIGPSCPAGGLVVLVSAGIGGGALLGARLPEAPADRLPFVAAAGAVALLAGSLGCALLGVGAVAGMAIAGVVTVPLAAVWRPA